ncbi:hypothetical protein D3C80_1593150 [compost metagenome]
MGQSQAQLATGIEDVAGRGVRDGIGIATWHLLVEHTEFLGGCGGLFKRAGQCHERRIERLDVGIEHFWRIALRVQADEHHLQETTIAAHQFFDLRGARQGGRTYRRALGEAEEHHRHAAPEAGQGTLVTLSILEFERATEDLVAHVLAVLEIERATGTGVATCQNAKAQQADPGHDLAPGQ